MSFFNYETDLLLITAASGKQAAALLPHVLQQWRRLRLNVSSTESANKLREKYPDAEVTQHDLADSHACKLMLKGVSACYLITPPFHAKESQCGINVIDAALAQKDAFKFLLHSSVIFPIKHKMLNHDSKRVIEEYLVESTLPYTILEPTHLMESVDLAGMIKSKATVMPRLWNPDTKFTLVSTRDVAEVAAKVLSDPERHLYATYQLVGTRAPMSYRDAANLISKELGRPLSIERKTIEEGVQMFTSLITHGHPEQAPFETRQAAARMFMYYNDKSLIGNPNVLEMLLGREPLGYVDWIRLTKKEVDADTL